MKKITFIALTTALFAFTGFAQNSIATYSVNYTSTWSNVTHPHPGNDFPSGAHYSKLVGATHNDQVVFFEMGGLATPGVEDVAELGNNTLFFSEVNTAIGNGTASGLIDGDSLPTSEGEVDITGIETTEDFPYITLISMIAPSPDWIVGVSSVELLDANGDWKPSIVIDLFPYDAGTDSGTDYISPNEDTDPAEPISSLQGVAPFSNLKMGTLTITLEDVVLNVNDNQSANFTLHPNPTSDVLNIRSQQRIAQIEVFDVLGSNVGNFSNNSTEATIDFGSLRSGVYLVKITSEDGSSAVRKVVRR